MINTGIEWLPEIKNGWRIAKVKELFYISKEKAQQKDPVILSLARSGIKVRDISNNEGQLAANYEDYNPVIAGDLLLNPMDLYSGANCNVSEVNGVISPAYSNLRKKIELNPFYFDYYFKVQYWTMAMFAHGKGVSFDNRWTLNADGLLNYELPLPSYDEQNLIVCKIKEKEEKINQLIANQEKQIEKLKEYKQSLLTSVLLNGLNNNENKIDTKINWIGSIPNDYNIYRVKNCYNLCGRIGWQGLTTSDYTEVGPHLITGTDFDNGIINWNTCVHITIDRFLEDSNIHVSESDLLITKDGTVGKVAVARNCPEKVSLNSGVMLLRPICDYCNSEYFKYVLWSNIFWKWYNSNQRGNSTIKHLYQEQFYLFSFPLPNIDRQIEVVNYLDKKCNEIDKLILIKKKKIDKINEYKKSLIYEYVTGKKEINKFF